MRRLEAEYPRTNRALGARVIEMRRLGDEAGGASTSFVLLFAVAFVLLLACANVANLLLSRAVSREREMAVRAALGAGRARIVRQLLIESLLLSAGGALAGLGVATLTLDRIRASLPELLLTTQPNVLELGINRAVLLYTGGLAIVSALLFGAAPALRAARVDLFSGLRFGVSAGTAPRHQRLRAALMVAEVAISVVLLVGAGLLMRAVGHLRSVDVGFNPDSVMTMAVSLPEYRYGTADAQRRFFEAASDAVRRVGGVESAAFVNALPFSTYDRSTRYTAVGQPVEAGREPSAGFRVVTSDYFATLRVPLVEGRAFDSRDSAGSQPVAIVNRTLARRVFGAGGAVGRQLLLQRRGAPASALTIVGIVGDVLHSELTARPEPEIYLPMAQAPTDMMFLAVRTAGGSPTAFTDAIRSALASVDPAQPVYHVKTMRDLVDAALLPNTTAMGMIALFAALALLLASIGIYGVTSYAVSQQAREFGVRLALGAAPSTVLVEVIRRGLTLVGIGAAIGGAAAIGGGRVLAAVLPGVDASDVLVYAGAAGVLVLVGFAACYVPARRAMRLDPIQILRAE
jgi:putative ABC transport system permease protein